MAARAARLTHLSPPVLQACEAASQSDRQAAAALRSDVESLTQQLDQARRLHHTASVTVQDQDAAFKACGAPHQRVHTRSSSVATRVSCAPLTPRALAPSLWTGTRPCMVRHTHTHTHDTCHAHDRRRMTSFARRLAVSAARGWS